MEYSFQLSDFFNYYVASNQTSSIYGPVGFYDSINMKREFSSERPQRVDKRPTTGDMLLPHQRFMQRFFSPHTPYDRLLVFHGLGTGKTCLYTAVAEFAKKENPAMGHVIILVRSETFVRNVIKEISQICTCTHRDTESRNCLDGPYIAKLTPLEEKEDREDVDKKKLLQRRTNALIGKTYDIMTFGKFAEKVYRTKQDGTFDDVFHNTYVIIDEAHNVKETKKEGGKKFEGSVYKQIWDFCHTVKGTKIMLLSGTPMRDKVFSEFVGVANLLLPVEEQLTTRQVKMAFNEQGFLQDRALIATRMRTKVSYLRSMVGNIAASYMGTIVSPLQFTKVVEEPMHSFQAQHYWPAFQREARLEEKEEKKEDDEEEEKDMKIWHDSIFASSFVFPDGTYGIQAEANFITLFDTKGDVISRGGEAVGEDRDDAKEDGKKVRVENMDIKPALRQYLEANGPSQEQKIAQLRTLSSKFAAIIKHVLQNRNKKTFIYSRYVNGAGCLLMGALLTYFGFERANATNIKSGAKPRFTIITNETNTPAMSSEAIDIFNHENNLRGELCQIMIGSHVVGEGFSFDAVRSTFVLSPYWNTATLDQAIGRTIRNFSHDRLPLSERTVDVYMLAAMYLGDKTKTYSEDELADLHMQSIDIRMYAKCEWKDIRIKQIERVLKEVAVDCVLNRDRNILSVDQPGSKACDYMDVCAYTCTEVSDLSYSRAGTIEDTYNLYYANNEIAMIIASIQQLFKKKSAYDFEELYQQLMVMYEPVYRRQMNSIVLARALYEMVSQNTAVYNRHGFKNYIRTDRNMFFLVDDPMCGSLYWNGTYADRPQPIVVEEHFHRLNLYLCNKQYPFILEQLEENKRNPVKVYTILQTIPLLLFNRIVECIYREAIQREVIKDELQKEGQLTEEAQKALALGDVAQVIYDKIKENFSKVVHDKETYVINAITKQKERAALLDDLLNPNILDEDIQWLEAGPVIEKVRAARMVSLEALHANALRYYATILAMPVIDPKTGKDTSFSIKYVHMPRYLKSGDIDKKKDMIGAGAVCGTEKFSNNGLLRLVVDLSVRMKKCEEEGISLLTNIPPLVSASDFLNVSNTTAQSLQAIVAEIQAGAWKECIDILAKIAWEARIKQYLLDSVKDKDWKEAKEFLIKFALEKVASYFTSDKKKVTGSFGQMEHYQERDKLITMLAENEWLMQYVEQTELHGIYNEMTANKEAVAMSMLVWLTGLPRVFFESADANEEAKKRFVREMSEMGWDGKYLLAIRNGFKTPMKKLNNLEYCAQLKKYFIETGLYITK